MALSDAARQRLALALLVLLPIVAHAPAWWDGRLVGPGDAGAMHYPLRRWVWEAWRNGELPSWNPQAFSGTPLLAAYRGGALYPPMVALAWLPPFLAFQILVLSALSLAGVLTFLYLRRLHVSTSGAYVAGLSFALGPYLVGHLDDTATLVAAPLLPLVLLAAESHMNRATPGRVAGLAGAVALLLASGSPHAARAGAALVAGRLLLGHLLPDRRGGPRLGTTLLGIAAGLLLAAPQVLPTLLLAREAGRQATGFATQGEPLPGLTGVVLRYVSHTPAAALAVAALPLLLNEPAVRVLVVALLLALGLQWGRGPQAAPGALALLFDFALAALAGLSLSAQWRARHTLDGRRLRIYFLLAALASAAALSVAAATLGPLPQTLAGAVGILAMALILYFALADARDPVIAGVWLLPLTVSFLLQPHGRAAWHGAPTHAECEQGTPTSRAIDEAMGLRRGERSLTLVRSWPFEEEADLAYANRGAPFGRSSANGYDPLTPLRNRGALDGMSAAGLLPGRFFRSDPLRLHLLSVRWVQVPASALVERGGASGLGETLDIALEPGRPRFFAAPLSMIGEVRLASLLADAVEIPDGTPVARIGVRLGTGRELPLVLRAGRETAEWAYDRPDVRARVAHARAPVFDSFPTGVPGFEGHRYLGVLPLPGRYWVDGIRIERLPGPGRLQIARLGLADPSSGRTLPLSVISGYLSDTSRFREAAVTPAVRLFELPGTLPRARVVERLRTLADGDAVRAALGNLGRLGIDPQREALAVATDVAGVELPAGATASRAEVVRASPGHIDVRALGPGLLVIAEGWDRGWTATRDGEAARLLRVNHVQIGLVLPPGSHRVTLAHAPRGFTLGLALALAGLLMLLGASILLRRSARNLASSAGSI